MSMLVRFHRKLDGGGGKRPDALPWCINTGKSLIPLTLRFLAQKRNLLIPLELSRVMHQGINQQLSVCVCDRAKGRGLYNRLGRAGRHHADDHLVLCQNSALLK